MSTRGPAGVQRVCAGGYRCRGRDNKRGVSGRATERQLQQSRWDRMASAGAQATGVGKGHTGCPDGKGLSTLPALAAAHSGFVSAVKGAKGALESGVPDCGRIWIMGWAWGIPRGQLEGKGVLEEPALGKLQNAPSPRAALRVTRPLLFRVSGPRVCVGASPGQGPPPPLLSYALRRSFSEEPPGAGQLASWAAVGQAGVSSLCPAHLRPYYPGPNPTGVKKAGAVETCVSVAVAADGGGLPGPGTAGALLSSWGPRGGRAPDLCIPPAGPTAPRHLLLGGVGALLDSQGSREGV